MIVIVILKAVELQEKDVHLYSLVQVLLNKSSALMIHKINHAFGILTRM